MRVLVHEVIELLGGPGPLYRRLRCRHLGTVLLVPALRRWSDLDPGVERVFRCHSLSSRLPFGVAARSHVRIIERLSGGGDPKSDEQKIASDDEGERQANETQNDATYGFACLEARSLKDVPANKAAYDRRRG
jgi:hypothetical protein